MGVLPGAGPKRAIDSIAIPEMRRYTSSADWILCPATICVRIPVANLHKVLVAFRSMPHYMDYGSVLRR